MDIKDKTVRHEIKVIIYDNRTIDIYENDNLIENVTEFKLECKINELPTIKYERYLC